MSDEEPKKTLTPREQKFVAALVSGSANTNQEALVQAGYNPTTTHSANVMAHEVIKRPHIQQAMSLAIQKKFPNIPDVGAEVIYKILNDEEESSVVKLKALDYLMKLFGWQAPTKHTHLTAKVDASQFQLPGEGDDDASS